MESTSLKEQERILASDWGGGKSPFGTSWSKFMMWIFNMVLITFMTFILISSSAVMAMGVSSARSGDPKSATRFLALTIVGGLIFLGCQAYEWTHFIREGATLTHNP